MKRFKILPGTIVCFFLISLFVTNANANMVVHITKGKKVGGKYQPQACLDESNCPGVKCTSNAVGGCNKPLNCVAVDAEIQESQLPLSPSVAQEYATTFANSWYSEGNIPITEIESLEELVYNELTTK